MCGISNDNHSSSIPTTSWGELVDGKQGPFLHAVDQTCKTLDVTALETGDDVLLDPGLIVTTRFPPILRIIMLIRHLHHRSDVQLLSCRIAEAG